jgi:hypothetical protein
LVAPDKPYFSMQSMVAKSIFSSALVGVSFIRAGSLLGSPV